MEISLTPEQVSFLERHVKSGRFASAEDAIREAVDLLEQHETNDLIGWDLDELRREVQLGIDQLHRGEGIELETEADWDKFRADIKARGSSAFGRGARGHHSMRSKLSPLAQSDLDEIWRYLARESGNDAVADRWIDLLVDEARRVGRSPSIGRPRPDLAEGYRSVSFRNYLIVYVKRKSVIEIARVLHGSRDMRDIFR